jgi:hypothetical protein
MRFVLPAYSVVNNGQHRSPSAAECQVNQSNANELPVDRLENICRQLCASCTQVGYFTAPIHGAQGIISADIMKTTKATALAH